MRYFYIDPASAAKPVAAIEGSEAHHIKNVLRLKTGDGIMLFDGTGCEYEAAIVKIDAYKVDVEIRRKILSESGQGTRIMLAQAFLKEKKMDDLVRRLSELGISGWIPFFSRRAVPRPDEKRLAARTQRWRRIATEALKQCKRKSILEIFEPQAFGDALELGRSCDLKIIFWENETTPLGRRHGSQSDAAVNSVMLMLGPEGGFTEPEIEKARQSGFVTAGLGPRILRAETAALAAGTLIQYLYGDMGPQNC